ncbi:MAG: hypothetical protein IH859_09375 [Chloroflexi bacterium]|nr:hypothetical protein [Chloroflexota bacterium]
MAAGSPWRRLTPVVINGLKKNQPLPAKGSASYQTQKDIRPGKEEDKIKIPIYEGEGGSKAFYNKKRGVVIITGEKLPGFLPKGSDVELTIEVDDSEIKVSASFPYLDGEIVENVIEPFKDSTISKEDLERELEEADRLLNILEDEYSELDQVEAERIRNITRELVELLDKGGTEHDTRDQILNNLQENLKELDKLKSVGEWPKIKQELSDALEHLESTNEQFGDEKTSQMVKELNEQAEAIFQKEDLGMAKDLSTQIGIVDFAIIDRGAGVALEISMIKGFDDNFDIHDWKDRDLARQLIDDGKNIIIANRATKSNLKPIVGELYTLLPDAKDPTFGRTDDELLKK